MFMVQSGDNVRSGDKLRYDYIRFLFSHSLISDIIRGYFRLDRFLEPKTLMASDCPY